MKAGTARLVVVVVTWNSERHLDTFFASLPAGLAGVEDYRLLVVDNASTDGTLERVQGLCPDAEVLQTGYNAGYSAAINTAARASEASDALLVLNPDVQLGPGCARVLLATLELPGCGISVPRHLDVEGRTSASLRRAPTLARVWAEALVGSRSAARLSLSELIYDQRFYDHPQQVDWASGAAMAISAECRAAVGGWDESFFLYSEEVDYCQRARSSGFTVRYVPEATITHVGGDFAVNPMLWSLLMRNRAREYSRRHGPVSSLLYRLGLVLGELLRLGRGPTHRAGLRAVFDFGDPGARGISN